MIPPSGPAWAALLDAAHQAGADVLICGTRGRGAFARALLGSTSSSLLHHADIPLLVVPDGGGALDGPVVAAYDGSEEAGRALGAVGRLLTGRATVVVHAWDVARASGQEYHADPASLQVSMAFLQESAKPGQEHTREGIFGPVVPCAPDAPLLDRVAGLSGRDPGLGVAGRAQ